MYEYLIILAGIFLITFVLEKAHKVHLYKNRKERFEIVGLFFVVGVVWDTFAILRGHWVFPPKQPRNYHWSDAFRRIFICFNNPLFYHYDL